MAFAQSCRSSLLTDLWYRAYGVSEVSGQILNQMIVLDVGSLWRSVGTPISREKFFQITKGLQDMQPFVERLSRSWQRLTPQQRDLEKQKILKAIASKDELNAFFKFLVEVPPPHGPYAPAERDAKIEIMVRIHDLIRELPAELQFKLKKLPVDQRLIKVKLETDDLIKQHEKKFDELFLADTKMTYSQYLAKLRASKNPLIQRALALLDKNQVRVVMRRQERSREIVEATGFQNQYVTGQSSGTLSTDDRQNAEATMLGADRTKYKNLDVEVPAKYATLMVEATDIKNDLASSRSYGPDLMIFRRDAIENRLMFYPGDSLIAAMMIFIALEKTDITPVVSAGFDSFKMSSWQKLFIPWSRRYLMIPMIVAGLNKGSFGPPTTPEKVSDLMSDLPHEFQSLIFRAEAPYWESQILGHLTINDVETFIFENTPPTGRFLMSLRDRKIRILDGRYDPPQVWNEIDKNPPQNNNTFLPTPGFAIPDTFPMIPGLPSGFGGAVPLDH